MEDLTEEEAGEVMPLVCGVCGSPWKLEKPLLYHHDQLHCDSHACSRTCEECKDWEHAVEGGATPCATGADQKAGAPPLASTRDSDAERGNPHTTGPNASPPPPGSFSKAPGYAAMMARLKGGGQA